MVQGLFLGNERKEAENLKSILTLANVPETDILIEKESRNTYENARYSAQILKKEFPGADFLLITLCLSHAQGQCLFCECRCQCCNI